MSGAIDRPLRQLACAGALWCLLAGAAAPPAAAAELAIGLGYDVPPECPNVDAFKAIVIGQIGHDPFSERAPDRVVVRIAARGRALDGRLEWRDASGSWVGDQTFPLVTADCARLTRAIGFALAVQLQLLATTDARPPASPPVAPASSPPPASPTATRESPPAPASPPATRESPPATTRESPPAARESPPTTRESPPAARESPPTTRESPPVALETTPVATVAATPNADRHLGPELLFGAGSSVAVGLSDEPILLGRLFAGWAWPHALLEVAAQVSLPSTVRRGDGAGFSQQQLLLGIAGCGVLTRWRLCLLVNAGEVRLAGQDVDLPTSAVVPAVQAGARIGVAQPVGRRAFVSAQLDGLALLSRWTGTLDHQPVWTAPRFAAALGFNAGVRFP